MAIVHLAIILASLLSLPVSGEEIEDFSLTDPARKSRKGASRKRQVTRRFRSLRANHLSVHAVGNYLGSGYGLGYEHRTNSWFAWGFAGTYSQAFLEGEFGTGLKEALDASTMRLSGAAKLFWRKRYYLGVRANISAISGNYGVQSEDPNFEAIDIGFNSYVLHPDLFIGTHFDLKANFFVAIDWVGFGAPIATSLSTDNTAEADQVIQFLSQDKTQDRILGEVAEQLAIYYLVVHFGYRF